MKFLLIATLLVSSAFAEDAKEMNLDQVKQHVSANVDQKIAALQAHKTCVQAAATKEAMKVCRTSHKDAMKKLHEENKGERQAWKDSKKKK